MRRNAIRASLRTSAGRDRRGVRAYEHIEIRYLPLEVPVPSSFDDPDDPNQQVVRTEMQDQTDATIDAIRELDLGSVDSPALRDPPDRSRRQ